MSRTHLRLTSTALIVLAASGLAACSSIPMPAIYKIDVQQGNVVDEDMLARLEPGMEKRKVRFLLGTPLVDDTFNKDRWHYLYSIKKGHGKRKQRLVVIVFEDDRLKTVEGDVVPGAARAQVERPEVMVSVPDHHGGTLFGRLTNAFGGDGREPIEPERDAEAPEPVATAASEAPDRSAGSEAEEPASLDAAEGEDRGLFSKLKSMFEEDGSSIETGVEPIETTDGTVAGSVEEAAEAAEPEPGQTESPGFVTRSREELASEEKGGATLSEEDETAPDEAGEGGFLSRLKKRFAADEESEPDAAAEDGVADENEGEVEDGFFSRLSKRFGLGPAAAAEAEEAAVPPAGE